MTLRAGWGWGLRVEIEGVGHGAWEGGRGKETDGLSLLVLMGGEDDDNVYDGGLIGVVQVAGRRLRKKPAQPYPSYAHTESLLSNSCTVSKQKDDILVNFF